MFHGFLFYVYIQNRLNTGIQIIMTDNGTKYVLFLGEISGWACPLWTSTPSYIYSST
jgi:hypothetical protein